MDINVNSCPGTTGYRCSRLLRVLALLVFAFPAPGVAGDQAYGENFFRVGKAWGDTLPAQTPLTPSPEAVADYQRQLESLQNQGGPYSDALAEPLAGLARAHLANGDPGEARRLYRRALHIVRVNEGLYSERQIPFLQALLGIYRTSGDLESLDQRYDYYFRLYGKGQPPYTEVRLGAALGYLRWQREAIRLGMDGERHRRLLNLYRLNDELIKATAVDPNVSPSQYAEVVLSQLQNLYLLEDRVEPRLEKIGVVATAPAFGGEWEQSDFDRKRLEALQKSALAQGARLMKEVIERNADTATPEQLAKLHLELGDWYQWHGSSRADQQYDRVVELLSAAGQRELLEDWLGQPVELPDNGAFWQPSLQPAGERKILVETRYDVSESGRISNLSGSAVSAEDESKVSRLKRQLKKTRFRPRWVNGRAEAVTGVERAYQWVN